MAAHAALIGALAMIAAPGFTGIETPARPLIARLTMREAPAPLPKPAVRRAVPAERYFGAHELDERPLILNHVEPSFPAEAGDASGRVRLELLISAQGAVDAVNILDAQPAGLFELAAQEAFAEARFRPGMRRGAAVKSALTLELLFGEPLPPDPRLSRPVERAPVENPNAVDAPDRAGIKKRSPKEPS